MAVPQEAYASIAGPAEQSAHALAAASLLAWTAVVVVVDMQGAARGAADLAPLRVTGALKPSEAEEYEAALSD